MRVANRNILIYVLFLGLYCFNCQNMSPTTSTDPKIVFQYSTINALSDGFYEGDVNIGQLKKYGNFGLGTFNGLDGEMVIIDHEIYKISADGTVKKQPDEEKSPFAVITNFNPERNFTLTGSLNLTTLEQRILTWLPSKNIFYAVKIQGNFEYVKTRSIPKQNKPFPRLIEASKKQNILSLRI